MSHLLTKKRCAVRALSDDEIRRIHPLPDDFFDEMPLEIVEEFDLDEVIDETDQ